MDFSLGLSKIVINIIIGESLCNDATTSILFDLYSDLVDNVHREIGKSIISCSYMKILSK